MSSDRICDETCRVLVPRKNPDPVYLYNFWHPFSSFSMRLKLEQDPVEHVTIKNPIIARKDLDEPLEFTRDHIRSCTFELCFENDLHVLSSDYAYKITSRTFVKTFDTEYHVLLFEKTVVRKAASMKINCDFYVSSKNFVTEELIHICFQIERFSTKCTKNESLTPDVDVGRMLLNCGMNHDIEFHVGNHILKAHKHILALKFRPGIIPKVPHGTMIIVNANEFYGDPLLGMHDYVVMNGKVVPLAPYEFKVESVQGMLSWIYTGKVENISELAMELIALANKYGIEDLKWKCEEHLLFDLRVENAHYMLQFAGYNCLEVLREKALFYLDKLKTVFRRNKLHIRFDDPV